MGSVLCVAKRASSSATDHKNNNAASKTYGQYYGRVFPRDGLNLKGFAKHLSEHGKLASHEMLVLALIKLREGFTRRFSRFTYFLLLFRT
jgi:hypothetical protein